MKFYSTLFALFALLVINPLKAQQNDSLRNPSELIQFTGIIVTPDSLRAVSDVNIRIAGTRFGTTSNDQGYFSIVVIKGDTLVFSSIGYKTEKVLIPTDLSGKRYTMITTMSEDTIYLRETVIKPYISRELFQHYFVTLNIPDEQGKLENFDPETLREMAYNMGMDGGDNAKYVLRQEAGRYYYSGQAPPIQLLNPFAWAQFVKAWKAGKLKIQKE